MACGWVDYSGAAPILLSVSLLPYWRGFYLPAAPDEDPDLELPEGDFVICDDFDFTHPKTDYDRACALGGIPAAQTLPVGPGHGLVLATELDRLTWWAESLMVVNGGSLPKSALLKRVEWSDECVWRAIEADFVLMNACYHGAAPDKGPHFAVRLEPGEYTVQRGSYGWADDDPALVLFRFVPSGRADPGAPVDGGGGVWRIRVTDFDGSCVVERDDDLLTRLRSVRRSADGAFVLDHGGPESLWVHINGDAAFVWFSPSQGENRAGAVPNGMWPGEHREVRFRLVSEFAGDTIIVPWWQLLPVEAAYRAAVEYLHSRSPPASVSWFGL